MRIFVRTAVSGMAIVFAVAVAAPARAHTDPTKDSKASRCDTWARDGHKPKKKKKNDNSGSHEHKGSNDRAVGPVYFHNHGGHYVIRGDSGYLEIVGGQGYSEGGNQGGYVQGEFDPGQGAPDMDGHTAFFAGQNSPNASGRACGSLADNRTFVPLGGPPPGVPGYEWSRPRPIIGAF